MCIGIITFWNFTIINCGLSSSTFWSVICCCGFGKPVQILHPNCCLVFLKVRFELLLGYMLVLFWVTFVGSAILSQNIHTHIKYFKRIIMAHPVFCNVQQCFLSLWYLHLQDTHALWYWCHHNATLYVYIHKVTYMAIDLATAWR